MAATSSFSIRARQPETATGRVRPPPRAAQRWASPHHRPDNRPAAPPGAACARAKIACPAPAGGGGGVGTWAPVCSPGEAAPPPTGTPVTQRLDGAMAAVAKQVAAVDDAQKELFKTAQERSFTPAGQRAV